MRSILFLAGCIGTRLFLSYYIKNKKPEDLPTFGYVGAIVSFAFFYLYFVGSDLADG